MKAIPYEVRRLPKKSLGYHFSLSTAKVKPVTGREWVYTATDEQMQVLYDIERLWESLEEDKYVYIFREVHDDHGFDGYTFTLYEKGKGHTHVKQIEGFPNSAMVVFKELRDFVREVSEYEARTDG